MRARRLSTVLLAALLCAPAAAFANPVTTHPLKLVLVGGFEFTHYPPLGRPDEVDTYLPPEEKDRWLRFFDGLPEDPDALVARIRRTYRINYILVTDKDGIPTGPEAGRFSNWPCVHKTETVALYRIP